MGRYGARRPQATRETLPIVVVVCDDSKTAPAYFSELKALLKSRCSVRVIPALRHGATGKDVIACASDERSKLSDPDGAAIWAIIDLEMASDSIPLTKELRELAEQNSIGLALSQPCFEIWILSHLGDTGALFLNCEAVLRRIKNHWKSVFGQEFAQKKAQADYRKLMDQVEVATMRAKKRSCAESQSWTEVWRVVDPLLPLLK